MKGINTMNELEKSVNRFYIKETHEVKIKLKNAEEKLSLMTQLYNEKVKELERAELIIELLFERLSKK